MKIKNLNIRKKVVAMALAGTLTTCTLLSGCSNHQMIDTKRTYNRAIIFDFENKIASVIDIKSWKEYENGNYQIKTSDNFWIITSTLDTKLVNDEDSEITVEDFIISILGEDAQINYLSAQNKIRTK